MPQQECFEAFRINFCYLGPHKIDGSQLLEARASGSGPLSEVMAAKAEQRKLKINYIIIVRLSDEDVSSRFCFQGLMPHA